MMLPRDFAIIIRISSATLAFCSVVACASDHAAAPPSAEVADGGDGGNVAADASVRPDAARGYVSVVLSQEATDPSLYAQLDIGDYQPGPPALTDLAEGGCRGTVREAAAPATAQRPARTGRVVVRGGMLPPEGVTVQAGMPFDLGRQGWTAGDRLTVEAPAGGDLAGFAAQALTAPRDALLDAPRLDTDDRLTLDRSDDLSLAWTGGGGARFFVTLGATSSATHRRTRIDCDLRGDDGRGAIPAKLLALLPAANDLEKTSFGWYTASFVELVSGDRDVLLSAIGSIHEGEIVIAK